jgi:hypothetical protein
MELEDEQQWLELAVYLIKHFPMRRSMAMFEVTTTTCMI